MIRHDRSRVVIESPGHWAAAAGRTIAQLIRDRLARGGQCSLALAGGHTPQVVYARLAEESLQREVPWHAVTIWFGDERAVPPEHPDSNYGQAVTALLSRVPVSPGRIHRMEAERIDLAAAAREYAALLPARLDVLLLGIGVDGHTASLFPGQAALAEEHCRVIPVTGGIPFVPRLTITPPVIRDAVEVVMLAAGPDKARAVARALEGPLDIAAVPAQLARGRHWLLDQAAASQLRGVQG